METNWRRLRNNSIQEQTRYTLGETQSSDRPLNNYYKVVAARRLSSNINHKYGSSIQHIKDGRKKEHMRKLLEELIIHNAELKKKLKFRENVYRSVTSPLFPMASQIEVFQYQD
ncbi:hypothetical protein CHS0354_033777 [Potamilus streckersoni]|uniref:Uncharacterized protein n=1 Tax=Potamilus streckersoni TaxID=2493646 RepID=A0AAE0VMR8_9BIVA|nr:hypothetical protein CHS0354_033777 [Potamilus streckersoni]